MVRVQEHVIMNDDLYKEEEENLKDNFDKGIEDFNSLSKKPTLEDIGETFNLIKFYFENVDPPNLLENIEKLLYIQENDPNIFNKIPEIADYQSVSILPIIFNTLNESIDETNSDIYNEIITKVILLLNYIIAQDSIDISDLIPYNPNPDDNIQYNFLQNVKQIITTISNINVFPSLLCTLKNLIVDEETHDETIALFPLSFFRNICDAIRSFQDESIKTDSVDNLLLVFEGFLEFPINSDEGYLLTDLVFDIHDIIENSVFALSHTCSLINRLIDKDCFDYSKANSNDLIAFIYNMLFNENLEIVEAASATIQRVFSCNQFPKSIPINWDHILQLMTPDCSDHLFLSLANLMKEFLLYDGSNYEYLHYFRDKYKIGTNQQKVYCVNVICSIIMTNNLIEKCFNKKVVHVLLHSLSLYTTNRDLLSCVPQSLGLLKQYALISGRLEEWSLFIDKYTTEIAEFMEEIEEELENDQESTIKDLDSDTFEFMKEIFYPEVENE